MQPKLSIPKAPLTLHRTAQTDAKRMKKIISVRLRSCAFVVRFLSAKCVSRTVMSVFYGEKFWTCSKLRTDIYRTKLLVNVR